MCHLEMVKNSLKRLGIIVSLGMGFAWLYQLFSKMAKPTNNTDFRQIMKEDDMSQQISTEEISEPKTSTDTELGTLLRERQDLQRLAIHSTYRRDQWLIALLLPIALILIVMFVRGIGPRIYWAVVDNLNLREVGLHPLVVFTTLFLIFLFLSSLPALYFQWKVRRLDSSMKALDREIGEACLVLADTRLKYLQEQLMFVATKGARINWIDEKRHTRYETLRQQAGGLLAILERIQNDPKAAAEYESVPHWDEVQFRITQLEELIGDEGREARGERNWKILSIGIALGYLIILIFFAIPLFRLVENNKPFNVFGIPFPIVVWSALGSFAAILYRFYKSPRRVNFEIELRWLFARPLIGIVMGALTYIALVSGLLIFSATPAGETPEVDIQKSGLLAQYWIVAFIAGFSDKFYEKIIELLVGKFGTGPENESESYIQKTESKVEITTEKTEE